MDADALKAEAILGQDAEDFVKSELGRYILGRVEQEREQAVQAFSKTATWRTRRIKELQNDIWRCDTFKGWLVDIVLAGKEAISLLEQRDG